MGNDSDPRISAKGAAVLHAFLDAHPKKLTGSELMDSLRIPSGTLYPILMRFEAAKWLKSEWEDGDPAKLGRPRRRYYRISAIGMSKARECLEFIAPGLLKGA